MINRICIIGVGLIGGSLARALKSAGACKEIVGTSRNLQHLQTAKDLNVIDRLETSLSAAVKDADIVVVAVPVGAMEAVITSLATCLPEKTVLTDVGSTKCSVIKAVKTAFGEIPKNFVPAHPIAGTEKTGVEAALDDLYKGRRVIITPVENTSSDAIAQIQSMWEQVGAEVTQMTAEHHDEVLAATSHLPHLLAYSLVDTLSHMDEKSEIFKYAAGGFRDFTRIASSDPTMWHDICLANADAMLAVLEKFSGDLKVLERAIRDKDSQCLLDVFQRAKQSRDTFCNE